MKFSFTSALVLALAADAVVASTWFSKAAYNKWTETELERWLSDHDIPYPTPADRKDLENRVKENWQSAVASPYSKWDANQLQSYLTEKGQQAKKGTEKNKDSLIEQVKSYWHETEEQASDSYNSVKDWIFDSWTESQLKAFLDRHGIPNPQPRNRDTLLKTARENYQTVANKAGETVSYPGNWLYESWSESDLKSWLDERGIPAPQPSSRDKLIASVRRNSRTAGQRMASFSSAAAASAASATQSLSDALLDSWSDSQIKEWADKNGIKVPQGSKRNELLALARKHRAQLTDSAASAYGAATSSAGNQYARATDGAASGTNAIYGYAQQYLGWIQHQLGLGASSASSSIVSATDAAGKSAASATGAAGKSAASAASSASASASSAASAAKKSAQKASSAAKQEL